MGRNSLSSAELASDDNGDLGFRSNHDRSLFKRAHPLPHNSDASKLSDRQFSSAGHRFRSRRKSFQLKGNSLIYGVILLAVFGFAFASMVLQSSITSVFRQGGDGGDASTRGLRLGTGLRFVASARFRDEGRLDLLRKLPRSGVRPPKLALILGNLKKNSESLMLFTVMKNLRHIGYTLKLYALKDGEARTMWEEIGGQMTILNLERYDHFDWSLFEGVIADSLEAKEIISSLMQEPFCSVPLIWIIQEDKLAKRLLHYDKMGWDHLISHWRHVLGRADVVVFHDFSLPLLYSALDGGNFFVIPGSPKDVWAAESYLKTHSRNDLRKKNDYDVDDVLVVVLGSSFFYNELSWDYAVAMHTIGPLLAKYAKGKDSAGSFKFIFLCGNTSNGSNDALEGVAAHLQLSPGSLRHYSLDHDVNGALLMADIVLYGSSQEEEAFPSLLIRSMSFGIPVVVPDLPVISKYVVDGVHGMIFSKHKPDDLLRIFSHLISSEGKLSEFAGAVASSGKLLARNLLAFESIIGYAKLMEDVLHFPSDSLLPSPISQIRQDSWEWNSFSEVMEQTVGNMISNDEEGNIVEGSSIVQKLEEDFNSFANLKNISVENSDVIERDLIDERMENYPGIWDEIYRNARKSEKLRFEANERDDGELQRTGRLMCIYEVYNGAGAWPLLHHGSLYRGLSLSRRTRRLSSDDVDAAYRLPILNDPHYRDLLCELGGMFSIAHKVDDIHKRPWVGFQSWKASGREVSLSLKAEKVLEDTIQHQTKGEAIYFWTRLDMDLSESNSLTTFWSVCDVLNGGYCRTAFENAFRHMYGLPSNVDALPPMPEDSDHWSALHSWVMPTPSFLEFMMFTRMFVDSLDAIHSDSSKITQCPLGVSEVEKKQCYCRILELLVNVWAYHSARRMVYVDPHTGLLEEQHPVDQRKGFMWVKYFNFTLLKIMDEDLAEAADDGDVQREAWLWPLTGEVHWQGIYEREREQRYRIKMDKKRKIKEKLFERMKYGYRQKSLGG
uniref:Glycosyl transferase family 1 domain-containing protein n=1 Tax=Chenopodium quinoa TaxID=63459 RepID=A0A803KUK3_CHEQI